MGRGASCRWGRLKSHIYTYRFGVHVGALVHTFHRAMIREDTDTKDTRVVDVASPTTSVTPTAEQKTTTRWELWAFYLYYVVSIYLFFVRFSLTRFRVIADSLVSTSGRPSSKTYFT
jgi:hypothetical protein